MKNKNLVYGWGVNDVEYATNPRIKVGGRWIHLSKCPYYSDWTRLLERAISRKFKQNNLTYKDCTVCEEWKYLSNFIKWVDSQPNRDWQNCELDKDLLYKGNKHYSPDTCCYVPPKLNSFITDRGTKRGVYLIGVSFCKSSKINPYKARCRNPFTGKGEHLGLFSTELEAHLTWKAKKHEHACAFAKIQEDPRLSESLYSWYL